ncbi:hypothetical protein [Deinococcus hopiensis]|uniref:hypothetical protein n=1 Tax=Deinococcus hopiensis TaxID=309885 RepID=UPI00111C3265|nr:hypothetical protein [Deinococcus hopiensis]
MRASERFARRIRTFFLGAGAGRAGAGLSILDQGSDQVIAARQQLALLMTGLPGAFTGRDL